MSRPLPHFQIRCYQSWRRFEDNHCHSHDLVEPAMGYQYNHRVWIRRYVSTIVDCVDQVIATNNLPRVCRARGSKAQRGSFIDRKVMHWKVVRVFPAQLAALPWYLMCRIACQWMSESRGSKRISQGTHTHVHCRLCCVVTKSWSDVGIHVCV